MTLLADRARPAPVPAALGDVSVRRHPGRLVSHALALALVLVVVHLLAGPGQLTQADEGAALAQARVLADDGTWVIAHPIPAADRAGTAFPIERSERIGDSFGYVPYAKHPAYPLLLAGAVRVAASACAMNAAALFVPCHRVLRTDGSLGGFRYGLDLKQSLLAREDAASR